MSTHTMGIVILRNKSKMLTQPLPEGAFCMTNILFMTTSTRDTINNIVCLTITIANCVLFSPCDRAIDGSFFN